MKYKNKNQNKFGFTLVELLVVIAIIGILSSISVVNLNSARESAKDAVARETLNIMGNAVFLCLNNGGQINQPNIGSDICTNSSANKWPDLTANNWYWQDASSVDENNFCYTARKTDASPAYAFRCKASGCFEIIDIEAFDPDCGGFSGP